MDKAQCLHQFWSSFGLTAWDENTVPQSATLPYITYEISTDSFDGTILLSASIWYRSQSWAAISQKAEQISSYIGNGGITIPFTDGILWIKRGSPFAQRMGDPDDENIRRILINIEAEFISEN